MMRYPTADLLAPLAEELSVTPSPTHQPQPNKRLQGLRVAGGTPPGGLNQTQSALPAKHLWYAAVFPHFVEAAKALAALERLARVAQRFTPLVSIELPNALLLEIKGSVKLFGSLERLHADIDAVWQQLSLNANSATTPSPLAALWLARGAKRLLLEDTATLAGALAALPLACTSWDAQRLNTLHAMGVRSVGELLRLPRSGIARRLGAATVLDLDVALAKHAAPRRAFIVRERFYERCDFETEIDAVAYLNKAFEALLDRCAQYLRRRQAGVQYLEVRLRHRVIPTTRLRLGLASITGEYRRLQDVVAQKLMRVALSAPVRGIELRSGALRPLTVDSIDVFAGTSGVGSRDTAPQLVERLRARLGERAVYGVNTVAEHRPEAAWTRVQEFNWQLALLGARRNPESGASYPIDMPRPVWLLDAPVPLPVARMSFEQGPERIESGWWDGKGVTRDYYIASSHGQRWWVFQERHSKCWYLHGMFA